jgi:diguanylate cyclase (GGDEF)-like protein
MRGELLMLQNVINEAELFQGAPQDSLKKLLADCPTHHLKKGQVLIAPGEYNQYVYMVISGSLTIHLDKPSTPSIRLVRIGETVGELSLIGSRKTSAYVVSKGASEVLIIDHKNFWTMINDMPIIARNMLHVLSNWIVSSDKMALDHQRQIEELEGVAKIDGLTGIYNRRSFDDLHDRFLMRSFRDQHPLVLIMIDVDNFKKYNDNHGHLGGDQALIALAKTLDLTVRPGDFASRYGGEEFAVILPATNLDHCKNLAERIRVAVMNTKITMPDGTPLPSITISMGIAESDLDGDSEDALLERADAKLYQAKKEGRNRFCL